jgi:hypothetical protein
MTAPRIAMALRHRGGIGPEITAKLLAGPAGGFAPPGGGSGAP